LRRALDSFWSIGSGRTFRPFRALRPRRSLAPLRPIGAPLVATLAAIDTPVRAPLAPIDPPSVAIPIAVPPIVGSRLGFGLRGWFGL
jgi:hypothetical protein